MTGLSLGRIIHGPLQAHQKQTGPMLQRVGLGVANNRRTGLGSGVGKLYQGDQVQLWCVADWRARLVESRMLAQQMNFAPTRSPARLHRRMGIHREGQVSNERMGVKRGSADIPSASSIHVVVDASRCRGRRPILVAFLGWQKYRVMRCPKYPVQLEHMCRACPTFRISRVYRTRVHMLVYTCLCMRCILLST